MYLNSTYGIKMIVDSAIPKFRLDSCILNFLKYEWVSAQELSKSDLSLLEYTGFDGGDFSFQVSVWLYSQYQNLTCTAFYRKE
jgi:hypothetical protein